MVFSFDNARSHHHRFSSTLFLSPERVRLWTEAFSLAAQVSTQLIACSLSSIRNAVIFDVLQSYINHVVHVIRHLPTIFSEKSWPKEFSEKNNLFKDHQKLKDLWFRPYHWLFLNSVQQRIYSKKNAFNNYKLTHDIGINFKKSLVKNRKWWNFC